MSGWKGDINGQIGEKISEIYLINDNPRFGAVTIKPGKGKKEHPRTSLLIARQRRLLK